MLEREVRVVNPLGLHARAAAKLVRCAERFESHIEVTDAGRGATSDARSILSILGLAISLGSRVVIRAEGTDESEAVEAVAELFASGFGEI